MTGSERYWREIPHRYRSKAARCTSCGKTYLPPRRVCRECQGQSFETTSLARTGFVETFTVISMAPRGDADEPPYTVGIIRLDDGVQVVAQVVDADPETISIGDRVSMEFRRVQEDGESGIICYGYKFESN